ncbi:MAG: DUF5615 family PIN-like protein [Nitrospirae bacterium]|nr:DUF5615 family PIN-like protein [Nitrospirota bacterium]
MKILLDECLPRRLAQEFTGHEVRTVPEAGWAGLSNGKLLALMKDHYDVFVTVDGNLAAQQNLSQFGITIVILSARSNRFEDLQPLMPEVLEQLKTIQPGHVIRVGASK